MLSRSSTTRCGESMASTRAISSQLSVASPATFLSWVNNSVSKECTRDVRAVPRSQIVSELISRKVGSWARGSARCHSIGEMELVNALCRLVEYADGTIQV